MFGYRFYRTPFDFPLAIFVLTAGMGVWATYRPGAAWIKFSILASGILLFYALSLLPEKKLWVFSGCLSLLGVIVAGYFFLTNDWQAQLVKFPSIHQLGVWWMSVRPSFQATAVHPNNIASLLAVIFPINLAAGLRAWQERRRNITAVLVGAILVTGMAILLSASRGAILTLAFVIGASGLCVAGHNLARRVRLPDWSVLALLALPLVVAAIWIALYFPGGLVGLLDRLPGSASASSRSGIAVDTWKLIEDFPFTGGGLAAFPGLYSQYILNIPYYFLEYSHNLLLEVALEQGVIGLCSLLYIMLGTAWLLLSALKSRSSLLAWGALSSLAVMFLHGLVTDAIYGGQGSPFLFLQAGMAISIARPVFVRSVEHAEEQRSRGRLSYAIGMPAVVFGGGMLAIVSLLAINHGLLRPWYSAWLANLGAVEMSRVELEGFPTGEWEDGSSISSLSSAQSLFQRALSVNPNNRTANHRLGLIACMEGDFPTSIGYLEKAYAVSGNHRGIRKALGYCYAWNGQFEQAAALLATIPEASQELETYNGWWEMRGQPNLAKNAGVVEKLLVDGIQKDKE